MGYVVLVIWGIFYKEDGRDEFAYFIKSMNANLIFNRGSFSSIASGLPLGDDLSKAGM